MRHARKRPIEKRRWPPSVDCLEREVVVVGYPSIGWRMTANRRCCRKRLCRRFVDPNALLKSCSSTGKYGTTPLGRAAGSHRALIVLAKPANGFPAEASTGKRATHPEKGCGAGSCEFRDHSIDFGTIRLHAHPTSG